MKKLFLSLVVLFSSLGVTAQVYMADVLKPIEEHRLTVSSSKADKPYSTNDNSGLLTMCNIYQLNGGISIGGAAQGAIAHDDHGFATYQLNKEYSQMTFWLGAFSNYGKPNNKSVLTIWADGRRIYDKPVFFQDAPIYVTLKVQDVEELKFKVAVGEVDIVLGQLQLWKDGATVPDPKPLVNYPEGKVKLVEQLVPYLTTREIAPITDKKKVPGLDYPVESINIARHEFKNGLQFTSSEQLIGKTVAWSCFWLNKRYEKLSFIVGPRDNQSSNSTAWLIVYGDKNKILYEDVVTQKDLPRQVVIDVKNQESIRFSCELRSNDFLGSITFGVVEIYAHPKGDTSVPKEGLANINKEQVAKLKSPCSLMMNILPYSVRGVAKAESTMFTGESSYITFSMGGEKYSEGIILATGKTLFDDQIDAYATFDLAEEFDYISFYVGTLTQHRVLDDDRILVYADDNLILDTIVHCTWPNMYFELPLNKCRSLRFAKPGSKNRKQCYIGIGDIALYRGKPVANDLFYHEKPDCPDEADLIDLCERPYFHFVGRYLSTLTNFDFNDCFIPGGSQRNFFQMKDGSKIYKGVMLEANVPLSIENISLSDAVMMFLVGAGSAIGSSNVSAYTGVSAGGGLTGQLAITRLMNNQNGGQASVVAFNPYGEYESCTFTIANKSEYWDEMSKLVNLGEQVDHPFKLNVFADQRLVKEIWVTNKMEPQTITVPIFKCHQLMFWLEPGKYRSGQFVLYDMKVSKEPCNIPIPEKLSTEPPTTSQTSEAQTSQTTAQPQTENSSSESSIESGTIEPAPETGGRIMIFEGED